MSLSVAVIATVKNEAGSILGLLDTLAAQTRQPDEIVIADGGSTDRTVDLMQAHGLYRAGLLRLLSVPGANISQGRNAAIKASNAQIIASTDAGVRLEPDWLAQLVRPLEEEPEIDVASGFFVPDPQTLFEAAMGATVLPVVSDIDPHHFWPSSRSVAFRKDAWADVGGYPEWLDYCEDLVFDFDLHDAGHEFVFVPGARVHFRPRGSLRAFFKQYYRYARGDGKANLWWLRHAVRYATYLAAGPALLVFGLLWPPAWLLLLLGLAAMVWKPYQRLSPLLKDARLLEWVRAALWVPVIRVTGDVAKMLGYPVGVWWRLQHPRASRPD